MTVIPNPIEEYRCPVFVYGTLQTGQGNHRRIKEAVNETLTTTAAAGPGRLWHNGSFPYLELAPTVKRQTGLAVTDGESFMRNAGILDLSRCIADESQDEAMDRAFSCFWPHKGPGSPQWIKGQLFWLEHDTLAALAALDRLEGFYGPERKSMYFRSAVTVWPDAGDKAPLKAWVYHVGSHDIPLIRRQGAKPWPHASWPAV